MAIPQVLPTNTVDEFRQTTNEISTGLGDVATLTTTATDAVGGVNEILADIGDVDSLVFPGSDLVSAVNAAKSYAFSITIALG